MAACKDHAMLRITVLVILGSLMALAQRTTANLYGSIRDASGGAVAGAAIRLVNEATGAAQESVSDTRGEFVVSFLPPGGYRLEVKANGFKTFTKTGLPLRAGEQLQYPVDLEIGSIAEQVTVESAGAVLDNASPTLNDRISRLQLSELPQSRRDFTQLLLLQPGVRTPGQGVFSFNGLASGGATVTLDGVDASGDIETSSTSMFNAFNFINVVSQEAIGEVNVSKGVYSAELARTFGGNINVITRGGTNQFHGSLFENWQNDILNARYFFLTPAQSKPPVRFNQFGASLGGPLVKDKLFFFAAYEGYRQRSFTNLVGNAPTPELKAQAIAANPGYRQFLSLFPDPNEPYAPGAAVGVLRIAGGNQADDNHFVSRVDYRLSDRYQLAFRYKRGRPNQSIPSLLAANPTDFIGQNESGNATLTRVSPGWTSETRFGVNLADAVRAQGLHANGKVPTIALQGQWSVGAETLINGGYSWSVEEIVMRPLGRHTLKFGGIFFDRHPRRYDEEVPIFTYANVADLLANRPNAIRVTFGQPNYKGRAWELGFFAQDDFRVRPNLMINLGMRYEYFDPYKSSTGHFYNPDGPAGAVQAPANFRPRGKEYNPDKNNFAPRVGFAWSVGGNAKNVVRGGFGMAYAPFSLRTFSTSHYVDPDLPFRFNYSPADIAQFNFKFPLTNEQFAQTIIGRNVPRGYVTTFPDIQNPYNMQWSFDYQRQLTNALTFQTGYVGNKAVKVTMTHSLNQPDYVTGIRPFPQALTFTYRDDADFSYYHGWQTSLRSRFSSGVSVNAHYTWSKVMATANGDFWLGNDITVQDETNFRGDLGPTSLDQTHRFVADGVYELPFAKWTRTAGIWKKFAEGWQVAGIFTAQSGATLNVLQSSNRPSSRPDYLGGDAYAGGSDRFLWLNRAVFAQVPTGAASGATLRPGNLGRNALRSPGLVNVDFSLSKSFAIRERYRFQIRAEAFNALNHTNPLAPVADVRNSNFGRILATAEARRMQLNARFTF
jgi:hypothetical protein